MYTPPKRTTGQGSSREDRLFQILVAFLWHEYECDSDERHYATTRDIAKLVKMQPTAHLRGMLNQLSRAKYIHHQYGTARNGTSRDEWCLEETIYEHPKVHELYEHARHVREAHHAS